MSIIPITPGELIALGAVWAPVCGLALGFRIYARRRSETGLGLDDWLIVPAFLLITGMAIAILTGVGLHSVGYATPRASTATHTATSVQQETTNKILWSFELMQIIALALVKLSVLFFYRRIFCIGSIDVFNILTIVMVSIVLLWTTGFFITWIFICRIDPAAYWISSATEAEHCIDTGMLHNAYAISDFITDVLILLLPIGPIVKLRTSLKQKIALVGIFMLGTLTVAASATRLAIYQKAIAAKFHPGSHVDIDLTASISMYWSMLESGLGFCAACLPPIQTILLRRGVQTIVRSGRSVASLRSHTSARRSKLNGANNTQNVSSISDGHDLTNLPKDKATTVSSAAGSDQLGRMNKYDIELRSLPEPD